MKPLITVLFFIYFNLSWAQNLVPNPSFEEYVGCPTNDSWVRDGKVPPWKDVGGGGVRYFHECIVNDYGVPVNIFGGANPRTGRAYLGTGFWAFSVGYEMQPTGVELLHPLIAGKKYNVEFYVSLCDSIWYAIKNIGIYFSINQPPEDIDSLLSYQPQVKYEGEGFLDDKESWLQIAGSFTAGGGENFITIGNFDGHFGSDTLFVGGAQPPSGQPDYYKVSLYYIDDVSVTLDTTTGINELEQVKFEVYPNPAKERLTIEVEQTNKATTLRLFDVTGREVFSSVLAGSKTTIDLPVLSAGIYTAVLFQNEAVIARRKIIIE